MASTPSYAGTPKFGAALLTTADTSLTAPSTVGTVITAGASGTRIDNIVIMGVATTTATLINLFVYDGSTYHLWAQVPVTAVTVGTTAVSPQYTLSSAVNQDLLPLILPTGHSLRATTTIIQTGIKVLASGGDL